MKIEDFANIESWKEARVLVSEVYSALEQCRDYGFKDQIQRASVSIMSNIAEGFDRGSNKEFIQFLIIARGSASEVRSLAYAALDLSYFDSDTFAKVCDRCKSISNLINGFIRFLKNTERAR